MSDKVSNAVNLQKQATIVVQVKNEVKTFSNMHNGWNNYE